MVRLLILLFLSALGYSEQSYAEFEPIGQVIWVQGTMKASMPTQAPRELRRRSPLYAHDVIMTTNGSSGEIAFTDNSVVSLRSETVFRIDDYQFKRNAPPSQQKSIMTVITGGFRTITGTVPKDNPEGYQMHTPVATIGVRGTQYSVVCGKGKGCAFKLEKGLISLTNAAGKVELDSANPFATAASDHDLPTLQRSMSGVFDSLPSIDTIRNMGNGGTQGGSQGGEETVSSFCIQ